MLRLPSISYPDCQDNNCNSEKMPERRFGASSTLRLWKHDIPMGNFAIHAILAHAYR